MKTDQTQADLYNCQCNLEAVEHEISQLKDDYTIRIKTVKAMIENEDLSYSDRQRLLTKLGCFRHFLTELKRIAVS